jgi:preprotein translocase subunit SecF
MKILKYKKIFFWFSGILVALSIFSIFFFGLNLGIDFTGGSVLEIRAQGVEDNLQKVLGYHGVQDSSWRKSDDSYIIRMKTIDEETKNAIVSDLSQVAGYDVPVERFSTVGPTLGHELQSKALVALGLVVVIVIIFIAWSFRHVSTPVSSWKYGFATIIALLHDIIITVGLFTLLGSLFGIEIDALFITALLVILGYSINDTIVVFDRVRDNLNQLNENKKEKEFENVLNKSFNQTIVRSINTSLTTLISLVVLYFIGVTSIQGFILALIIGIILGTYSSIFLAIPLLSVFQKKENRNVGR